MSRGLGAVQAAILAHLASRGGGDVLTDNRGYELQLAPGVHDTMAVFRELVPRSHGRFADPCRRPAFARGLASLIRRRLVTPVTVVPIVSCHRESRWHRFVHRLADGTYLVVPNGRRWQRRFVGHTQFQ